MAKSGNTAANSIENESDTIELKNSYTPEEIEKLRKAINPLKLEDIRNLLLEIGSTKTIKTPLMPPKSKNNIEVKITALDFNLVELFSLFQHSKNEVENFLKRNISENQTISDFKDRFRDAIKFLEETSILSEIWLYRVPHLENILTNMFLELDKIKNMQDLINFVSSFNSNIETEIKSLLLKIMFCIIDFRSNDSNKQEALLTEIIQIFTETDGGNPIIKGIEINEEQESFSGYISISGRGKNTIYFFAKHRGKTRTSKILKELSDSEYGIMKNLGDNFGITFYIDGNFRHLLTFIGKIKDVIGKHNIKNSKRLTLYEIGTKGFDIGRETSFLNDFSTVKITESKRKIRVSKGKEKLGKESGNLYEVKFKSKYEGIGAEIKFHLFGNENEIGLQDHRLYKLHTRVLGLAIRLGNRKRITEKEYRAMALSVIDDIFNDEVSKHQLLSDLKLKNGPSKNEVIEALLSWYRNKNIKLGNQITNLQGLISSLIKLPPPITTQAQNVVNKVSKIIGKKKSA